MADSVEKILANWLNYTELEKRPIYALQALLAGQSYCSKSLQLYHLCLSRCS
jgi:hypothetical protein